MSLHSSDILSRLRRFLDRRQAPRRVEGKPQAEADEVQALAGAVERNAPRGADALADWWPAMIRHVLGHHKRILVAPPDQIAHVAPPALAAVARDTIPQIRRGIVADSASL